MTTKPATPLPWRTVQDRSAPYSGVESVAGRQVTHSNGATSDENAAYIAHAANAYPRLIAALRDLVQAEEQYGAPDNTAVNQAWEPAQALLRELGEL